MNVFVVDRNECPDPPWCWQVVGKKHRVHVGVEPPFEPDAVIGMGVTTMEQTFAAFERWPKAKRFCYNWDVYAWIWEPGQGGKVQAKHDIRPNEYDYVRYGDLLRMAREVWVPSACTGTRTRQWYGEQIRTHVILSACPWWEHPNVRDDGYVLNALRHIPDPRWGTLERCCERLGIPCRSTRHELPEEEYRDAVAGCRFIVNPLYEASTGGLSLMEAYYHGKPVLCSRSEWNGAWDYFGPRAFYFTDEVMLEMALRMMWGRPHLFKPPSDHKEWIKKQFSEERLAQDIMARIEA